MRPCPMLSPTCASISIQKSSTRLDSRRGASDAVTACSQTQLPLLCDGLDRQTASPITALDTSLNLSQGRKAAKNCTHISLGRLVKVIH